MSPTTTASTSILYPIVRGFCFYTHDCQRNIDTELPVLRIYHPKLCVNETHPILGCIILHKHRLECKICKMGNSVPILRRQSCIMLCNRVIYHLLVFESRKTDVKPIFVSLEQCQNLTLILETTKIGESGIFLH